MREGPLDPIQSEGSFYLWPENLRTWQLWLAIQTQWVCSMSGHTGLAYAGVMVVIGHHIKNRRRQKQTFMELQAMERAALEAWQLEREKQATS